MKKISTLSEAGVYLALNGETTCLISVSGFSPFLQIMTVINFDKFIQKGKIEEIKELDLRKIEWYKFDYITKFEDPDPVKQKKFDINTPYTQKNLKKWLKIMTETSEAECVRTIMSEYDYTLDYVQTEIIPAVKRWQNEVESC